MAAQTNTERAGRGAQSRTLNRTLLTMVTGLALMVGATQLLAATPTKSSKKPPAKVQVAPAQVAAAKPVATTAPTASTPAPLVALGAGDVISVQVFGRPELGTTTAVADDGTIAMPLAGNVAVAGLSPSAAAQKVAQAYKNGQILRNPQVTVLLSQSRSQLVSVLGEVRTPGRFPVESRTTVLDLLAQAGGTTERSGNVLYLMRANASGEMERRQIDLRGLQDHRYSVKVLTIQGGDSIFVPPAEQFYIYGQVQQPNAYRLEPEMTVLQAISRSGGLTRAASSSRIEIKRRESDGQLVAHRANLNDRIQADDVIYVKESLF